MENFRASLIKFVNIYFRAGSIRSKFRAEIAADRITLRFSEGGVPDDGDDTTKCEDVIDPRLTPRSSSTN